ncbi:MAG TPA: MFS transporter, partial [Gaiellaceae bacterium]|nr:MFS transporter [Gaiellaceae bacterium]
GGVWADRLPRQLVMIGSDVLRGSVQAFVAAAFFVHAVHVWQLAGAAFLLGIGASFFNPASTGLVPEIVSAARLQEANALIGLSRSAINVAGPAISGLVVATLGFGVVFAVDAASFAASFLCLVAMRLPSRVERPERRSMTTEALEGLRAVRERRWMVAVLCADLVFNFAFAAYFVLGPTVVKSHFAGARDWGLMMTAASIGSLLAGAFVLRVKPRRPLRVAYVFGLAMPLQLLALALPVPLPVLMLGSGLVFFNVVVVNTFWVTLEQQYVPPELISRVDSLGWIASVLVMPVGLVIVGPIADALGVGTTLVGAAALGAASLAGALAVRDVRDLERRDAEPEPSPAAA